MATESPWRRVALLAATAVGALILGVVVSAVMQAYQSSGLGASSPERFFGDFLYFTGRLFGAR